MVSEGLGKKEEEFIKALRKTVYGEMVLFWEKDILRGGYFPKFGEIVGGPEDSLNSLWVKFVGQLAKVEDVELNDLLEVLIPYENGGFLIPRN